MLGLRRYACVRQEPGRRYRLLYGNSRVDAARYEMTRLTAPVAIDSAPVVATGTEVANPAWVSPEPWTERHPAVLWAVLIVVVLVLGGLALRAMR